MSAKRFSALVGGRSANTAQPPLDDDLAVAPEKSCAVALSESMSEVRLNADKIFRICSRISSAYFWSVSGLDVSSANLLRNSLNLFTSDQISSFGAGLGGLNMLRGKSILPSGPSRALSAWVIHPFLCHSKLL